jgi:Trk-type K+ transport system membrane component
MKILKEADYRLTDQSMIPFNGSFLLIYVLNVVMLAGNHALPMMLRFYIWLGTKLWRRGQINETLHFLLDHPRRYVPSALPPCLSSRPRLYSHPISA